MTTNSKELILKFYQNLGKLFYAIAKADNRVHAIELNKLKELVKTHWLTLNPAEAVYSKDAAYQMEIMFSWLNTQETVDAKTCFDDFVNYKNNEKHLFTTHVKHLILKTARMIATSFSGINKSELIMLAKLNMELKNI
tara:strand:+ start:3512 stop:3925 length:414 start_codon:yes stop_codon:yes gene_type:complete